MKNYAIISDIHGCFETLQALLEKLPKDHELIFAGDMIDRGPRSREVLLYAMNNGIRCVMGNHEHLMLDHYLPQSQKFYHGRSWMRNGGIFTTESFQGNVPHTIRVWVANLPLAIIDDNLAVSHTGHGGPVVRTIIDALWDRSHEFPEDGYYRVFGHTQEEEAVVTENWAMIDTGAAYKAHGYGKLTAFLWPSKEIISQEYCDTAQKSDEDL
jgi:serine/threonine protein phosphatase 1